MKVITQMSYYNDIEIITLRDESCAKVRVANGETTTTKKKM